MKKLRAAVALRTNGFLRKEANVRRFKVDDSVGGSCGIMLPDNPLVTSALHLPGQEVSAYSEVMMGKWKHKSSELVMRRCQDATLIISNGDGYHLGALLDGLGPFGSDIPRAMCESINSLWHENGKGVSSQDEILEFLLEASRRAIDTLVGKVLNGPKEELKKWEEELKEIRAEDPGATPRPKPVVPDIQKLDGFKGGTTIVMFIVHPDWRFFAASAGDSPLYLLEDGTVRRLFDHKTIWDDDGSGKSNTDLSCFPLRTYASFRNLVDSAIGIKDSDVPAMKKIDTCEGVLHPGDALIGVTDGFTKNAKILLDENGRIIDVSGEKDMQEIVNMGWDAEGIGMDIVQQTRTRMALLRAKGAYMEISYENQEVLVPADDDLGVLVLRRNLIP